MGAGISTRRRLLRGGLALAGLGLLSGCGLPSLAWQQPARVPRIGYTWNGPVSPTFTSLKDAFVDGMRDLGFVEDETFVLEVRRASGDPLLARKQLELLMAAVPTVTRVVTVLDTSRVAELEAEAHEAAARSLGLELWITGVDGHQ
jgi:hypothetical protein